MYKSLISGDHVHHLSAVRCAKMSLQTKQSKNHKEKQQDKENKFIMNQRLEADNIFLPPTAVSL